MSAVELGDLDPIETQEWRDALKAVQQHRGASHLFDGPGGRGSTA
jgi:pyruvate dehydrogenase complex dehydrogenase (E1) component